MAIVTGYTSQRMKAIEDATVVSGLVVGDDLVLTRYDGQEIVAGPVRGPIGPSGPPGPGIPPGSITLYGGKTAPAGYLLCDGSLYNRTDYADLFAAIGVSYGEGDGSTTFAVPDLRQMFARGGDVANDVGRTDGYVDQVVPPHSHVVPGHSHATPLHHHSMVHTHSATTSNHTHDHNGVTGLREVPHNHSLTKLIVVGAGSGNLGLVQGGAGAPMNTYSGPIMNDISINHNHSIAADTHNHDVTIASAVGNTGSSSGQTSSIGNTTTTSTGSNRSEANCPPYLTVNYIIRF